VSHEPRYRRCAGHGAGIGSRSAALAARVSSPASRDDRRDLTPSVTIAGERVGATGTGLRNFDDAAGATNLDLAAVGGAILLVSQFTLLGDTRRVRRPSFVAAARGEQANELHEAVATHLRAAGIHVETGVFGADMAVELLNDGPVTILLDTQPQAPRGANG
jgi:D-tyrosyl-tRNA(Tyr) deacylase